MLGDFLKSNPLLDVNGNVCHSRKKSKNDVSKSSMGSLISSRKKLIASNESIASSSKASVTSNEVSVESTETLGLQHLNGCGDHSDRKSCAINNAVQKHQKTFDAKLCKSFKEVMSHSSIAVKDPIERVDILQCAYDYMLKFKIKAINLFELTDVRRELGYSLFRLDNIEHSEDCLNLLLLLNPKSPEVLEMIASCFFILERYSDAVEFYQSFLDNLDSNDKSYNATQAVVTRLLNGARANVKNQQGKSGAHKLVSTCSLTDEENDYQSNLLKTNDLLTATVSKLENEISDIKRAMEPSETLTKEVNTYLESFQIIQHNVDIDEFISMIADECVKAAVSLNILNSITKSEFAPKSSKLIQASFDEWLAYEAKINTLCKRAEDLKSNLNDLSENAFNSRIDELNSDIPKEPPSVNTLFSSISSTYQKILVENKENVSSSDQLPSNESAAHSNDARRDVGDKEVINYSNQKTKCSAISFNAPQVKQPISSVEPQRMCFRPAVNQSNMRSHSLPRTKPFKYENRYPPPRVPYRRPYSPRETYYQPPPPNNQYRPQFAPQPYWNNPQHQRFNHPNYAPRNMQRFGPPNTSYYGYGSNYH